MLDIWDWELLANPSEDRVENWRKECREKYQDLYDCDFSDRTLDERYNQILGNPLFYAIALLQENWLRWHWITKHRLFRLWYQNLNKDKRHWLHGRGRIYILLNDQQKIDTFNCTKLYASWCLPTNSYHLEVLVGGEDDGVMVSFACGLFSIWFGIENIIPKQWADKISKYDHERITGISFHHGSVWFDFWRHESGYAGWEGIHLSFDVVEFLLGSQKYSKRVIENGTVTVELPEGRYRGDAILYEATWKRPRNPFPLKVIKCELSFAVPIPIPGKGENSYDIDDDAIYGMTTASNSIEEALANLKKDVLKTRKRHGGDDWQPGGGDC
jgi:hypothetical protein